MMIHPIRHLNENEFRLRMKSFCEENPGLVKMKPVGENRILLQYRKKVFFKKKWSPEILETRGTIVDHDFNVIQRPFTKIFNLGEQGTTIHRDSLVEVSRKVNGFMAAGTIDYDAHELLISTTGSTDSSFVALAREYLDSKKDAFNLDETFIFEIVDQERDPHVIPERNGVYLLGSRRKVWNAHHWYLQGSDDVRLGAIADRYGFFRPEQKIFRFSDIVEESKTVTHEGFVVRMVDHPYTELKLKSPFYSLVKWIGRMRNENVVNLIRKGTDSERLRFHDRKMVESVMKSLKEWEESFLLMNEQQKFEFLRESIIEGGM